MKTLEYIRIKYNLIIFFKLVNNETTIDSQTFFKPYKNNYSLRSNIIKYTCTYHFNNVGLQSSFFIVR